MYVAFRHAAPDNILLGFAQHVSGRIEKFTDGYKMYSETKFVFRVGSCNISSNDRGGAQPSAA